MFDQTIMLDAVGALDVALYSLLVAQALIPRLRGPRNVGSAAEAFEELRVALLAADPGIPLGFTWREACERARALGVEADWPGTLKEIEAYEAFRYGMVATQPGYLHVLSLAKGLRRGG